MRLLLTETLGLRGDPSALPALARAAETGDTSIRVAALRALAQLGDSAAGTVLLGLWADSNHDVAQAAQAALVALPGKAIDASILALLASKDPTQQVLAAELMGKRRMLSAVPALETAAADANLPTRIAALKSLREIAPPTSLSTLLGLLAKAPSPETVEAAEQAVTETAIRAGKADDVSEQIASSLTQAPTAQKCALLRALAAIGGSRALKCEREALAASEPEVHTTAIRALAGWNNPEVCPDLLELARTAANPTDKMLCLRGYLGFAGHTDIPEPQRLEMCRQATALVQREDEKKLLLSALADANSSGALEMIQPFLADAGIREEASTAAVNLSEKLINGGDAAKIAPQLVTTLQKVGRATSNRDLARRITVLIDKANSVGKTK